MLLTGCSSIPLRPQRGQRADLLLLFFARSIRLGRFAGRSFPLSRPSRMMQVDQGPRGSERTPASGGEDLRPSVRRFASGPRPVDSQSGFLSCLSFLSFLSFGTSGVGVTAARPRWTGCLTSSRGGAGAGGGGATSRRTSGGTSRAFCGSGAGADRPRPRSRFGCGGAGSGVGNSRRRSRPGGGPAGRCCLCRSTAGGTGTGVSGGEAARPRSTEGGGGADCGDACGRPLSDGSTTGRSRGSGAPVLSRPRSG